MNKTDNSSNNVTILEFDFVLKKLFRDLISEKEDYEPKIRFFCVEIEIIYRAIKDSYLLEFDSALWVPVEGNADSKEEMYAIDLKIDKVIKFIANTYFYKLPVMFVITYKYLLVKIRKKYGDDAYKFAADFFSSKTTNNIKASFLKRIETCGIAERDIKKFFALYDGYKFSKCAMSVFKSVNGMSIAAFYRKPNSDNFFGNEHQFIKDVLPFLHAIFAIKYIPWISILDEDNKYKKILNEQNYTNEDFMSLFIKGVQEIHDFKCKNTCKFYVRGNNNSRYVFFSVRMFDFRKNSNAKPLLAVAAFLAQDFEKDGKYYEIYGNDI